MGKDGDNRKAEVGLNPNENGFFEGSNDFDSEGTGGSIVSPNYKVIFWPRLDSSWFDEEGHCTCNWDVSLLLDYTSTKEREFTLCMVDMVDCDRRSLGNVFAMFVKNDRIPIMISVEATNAILKDHKVGATLVNEVWIERRGFEESGFFAGMDMQESGETEIWSSIDEVYYNDEEGFWPRLDSSWFNEEGYYTSNQDTKLLLDHKSEKYRDFSLCKIDMIDIEKKHCGDVYALFISNDIIPIFVSEEAANKILEDPEAGAILAYNLWFDRHR